ncbi:acyl transferase/acyl hydrolase/lysophospholipase [Aspergillus granulosus]|uniref:Acyl transferase/acyl hydrolase/lysophospholipase n=1 Tax=Aspergillus granulosus TaxID=176169 RepID=A0ABR4GZL5_9EURO
MAYCDHLAWLRHVQSERTGEITLEDTGRFIRIIKELPRPSTQTPQLALFIGTRAKDIALKEIFPQNNLRRRGERENINLRLETTSLNSDAPLLFADSSPFVRNPTDRSQVICHETLAYSACWKPEGHSLIDIVYNRLLFLFSDVVCVFADDFSSLDALAMRLVLWAEIGSSQKSAVMRPRLLIITTEDCQQDRARTLLEVIQPYSEILGACFSSTKIIQLAGPYLSPTAKHQNLRDEIRRQRQETLAVRQKHCMLFCAEHLAEFFRRAVLHTAMTTKEHFCHITAARGENKPGNDFTNHLVRFLDLAREHKTPFHSVASYIASSILMDAYPPRMHVFTIDSIFREIYELYCTRALIISYGNICMPQMRNEIQQLCYQHFDEIRGCNIPASKFHWQKIRSLHPSLALFRNNRTCLYCLRRLPEYHLSCGHSVCQECLIVFGVPVSGREQRWSLQCIFDDDGEALVDVKPKTAGVRAISIDGGGSRGVTPLEFLKGLQETLLDCPLHEMVDIACGSSSGGLITLAKFHLHWPVDLCAKTFESLAIRCFQGSKSMLGLLKSAFNYVVTDAIYNESTLESSLKATYGSDRAFFAHVPDTVQGVKVAVTAMTHRRQRAVFTNYNASDDVLQEGATDLVAQTRGYFAIRPKRVPEEPLLWQVARATSAAPIFFKPMELDIGDFWDGALGFPNPSDLAGLVRNRSAENPRIHVLVY